MMLVAEMKMRPDGPGSRSHTSTRSLCGVRLRSGAGCFACLGSAAAAGRGRRCRALPLEAFAAVDRASLRGLEGDGGLLAAVGAHRLGLYLLVAVAGADAERLRAFSFAGLAALRFILELFIVEEQLFSGRKNKIRTAVHALQ